MGEKERSTKVPLLTDGELEQGSSTKGNPLYVCLLRWAFKSLMWFIFITWVLLIFAYPSESLNEIVTSLFLKAQHTVFGLAGGTFLVFSGPIIILAALAYVYIGVFSREEDYEKKRSKIPRLRLWTFPVIVDGPFGVVSAAEFIGIVLVAAYVVWAVSLYAIQIHHSVTDSPFPSLPGSTSTAWVLDRLGLKFGSIGLFLLALLFLPIARGSVLLRLIDIPFEHCTRYHVWLGHLTMVVFTLHGVFYMSSWIISKCFLEKILEWRAIGVANLAGVVSLFTGLLMWVTSLHPVRKAYFELFFYTHQLYVVFIVFFALHIGDFICSIAAGGIFLFILDRFLRFYQSRTKVDVISAACLPCGTVEIVLAKPPNLRYNALSFIFLQVRELSWLQWHPFSVSSSPLDGENHMSILIKVLGQWTARLRDIIITSTVEHGNKAIAASVEGPYGHELPYHLEYEHLILVAGGIGISPFLAILSDVIQRIQQNKANCLPKNMLVVWAVKNSQELSLISSINHLSISPSFLHKLNLAIQAYVTQESEPPLEDGLLHKNIDKAPIRSINIQKRMSSLVGTGNNIFAGAYFAISTIGFIALYTLLQVVYVQPFMVSTWWLCGLLLMSCMVASVLIFGGMVVFLWYHWEKKRQLNNGASMLGYEEKQPKGNKEFPVCDEASKVNLHSFMNTQYGRRPNFQGIFSRFSEQVGHVDVGVMVCGPKTLQSSVAKVCRTQNIRGKWNYPIFHFHSHSFDL